MSMLYELHNQGQDWFVYTCNNCKGHVESQYHCTVCDVSVNTDMKRLKCVVAFDHSYMGFSPVWDVAVASWFSW
jgi:hypothetical protein